MFSFLPSQSINQGNSDFISIIYSCFVLKPQGLGVRGAFLSHMLAAGAPCRWPPHPVLAAFDCWGGSWSPSSPSLHHAWWRSTGSCSPDYHTHLAGKPQTSAWPGEGAGSQPGPGLNGGQSRESPKGVRVHREASQKRAQRPGQQAKVP